MVAAMISLSARPARLHQARVARISVRAFFAQFFTSESVTSDIQLRQTIIWVLALLVVPGFVLVIELFPHFSAIAIRATVSRRRAARRPLEWIDFSS